MWVEGKLDEDGLMIDLEGRKEGRSGRAGNV